jgi:hypothetical protein
VACDAHDQCAEQQGSDNRLDQPQEDEAQDPEIQSELRPVVTDLRSDHHADQDPGGQRFSWLKGPGPARNPQRLNFRSSGETSCHEMIGDRKDGRNRHRKDRGQLN